MGDIALVINDSTSSNNGSYIYNGSGWSTLALYNWYVIELIGCYIIISFSKPKFEMEWYKMD